MSNWGAEIRLSQSFNHPEIPLYQGNDGIERKCERQQASITDDNFL